MKTQFMKLCIWFGNQVAALLYQSDHMAQIL